MSACVTVSGTPFAALDPINGKFATTRLAFARPKGNLNNEIGKGASQITRFVTVTYREGLLQARTFPRTPYDITVWVIAKRGEVRTILELTIPVGSLTSDLIAPDVSDPNDQSAPLTLQLDWSRLPQAPEGSSGRLYTTWDRQDVTASLDASATDAASNIGGGRISDEVYIQGRLISPKVLPEISSSQGWMERTEFTSFLRDGRTFTWQNYQKVLDEPSVIGWLPTGLTYDPETRTISGTPTQSGRFQVRVVVSAIHRNAYGELEADYGFGPAFEIVVLSPLSFADQAIPDQTFVAGGPDRPNVQLPAAEGGSDGVTYQLTTERGTNEQRFQGLPPWLTFDPETRTLAGGPKIVGDYEMLYEAVDEASGQTAELRFTISIVEPEPVDDPDPIDEPDPVVEPEPVTPEPVATPPSFGEQSVDTQVYTIGVRRAALSLPEATGGSGALSYRLITESATNESRYQGLPPWLVFNAGTRTLSGGATIAGEYQMLYEAVDEEGRTAQLRFTIRVEAP